MSQNKNLILDFDYLLCGTHNVVVMFENKQEHLDEHAEDEEKCMFIGQQFSIKKPVKKLSNDISQTLVRQVLEKRNIEKWETRHAEKKRKFKREQELFFKQMPVGDSIINLEAITL